MGDVDLRFLLERSLQMTHDEQIRAQALRRREAEHESATEELVRLAKQARMALGYTVLARQLEEALERYRATLPEIES